MRSLRAQLVGVHRLHLCHQIGLDVPPTRFYMGALRDERVDVV